MSDPVSGAATSGGEGWGEWSRYVLENIREAKMATAENNKRLSDLEQRVSVLAEKVHAEVLGHNDLRAAIETAAKAAEAAELAARAADSAAKAAISAAEASAKGGDKDKDEGDASLMTEAGWRHMAARYGSFTVIVLALLLTFWKLKGWI